jgi:hypothetical protein
MGKTYHAVNTIRHGMAGEGEKVFSPGAQVTGLTKEEMLDLWNAGVLEERDEAADKQAAVDARDARIAELEAQLAAMKAEQEASATPEASSTEGVDETQETGGESGVDTPETEPPAGV